jgi:murein DD-endopeptidase MepM/ murein hydrolase activator NlpD
MTLIPKFDTATEASTANSARAVPASEVALRRAAAQFEALLLTQLTASLNPKDEDEGNLFSNSGGAMKLARQMYSEQLAKSMAESGGIGIAEMIMAQVTKRNAQPLKHRVNQLTERAMSAVREIKNETIRSSAAKTNPSMNASELYPQAIIISEASTSSEIAAPGFAAPDSISSPSPEGQSAWNGALYDSSSATGATRPRRVLAFDGSASILNGPASLEAPRSTSASTLGNSRSAAVAHVAFQVPVQGQIRSQFGMRRDPINGRMRLHQGVDIAAKMGTPIEAAAAGTVLFAGRNKGYGNMVMIEHADGRRTIYAHAQSLFVKSGDPVSAGQTIAAVGSTGHSTGPHLHFEVRESNRSVNPLTLLANDIAFARR